jgi:hypothetical protein
MLTGPMPLDAFLVSWRMANSAWRAPTFVFRKVSSFEKHRLMPLAASVGFSALGDPASTKCDAVHYETDSQTGYFS